MASSNPKACVFIATSLDGFIARDDGDVGWLPDPGSAHKEDGDVGYGEFMEDIFAIVLGRKAFEMVIQFPGDFAYASLPLALVVTNNANFEREFTAVSKLPPNVKILVSPQTPKVVLEYVADERRKWEQQQGLDAKKNGSRGGKNAYIDGGELIQWFLRHQDIDEMIVTRVPVLLGSGRPLFDNNADHSFNPALQLEHVKTEVYKSGMVQSKYVKALTGEEEK